ncbi:MAG: phage protein Gp27 family protein [Candidatus Binatus sp.]
MNWQIERLPREDRNLVDQYLVDHDFHGYDDLVELLRRRGLDVGVGALKGYARRFRMRQDGERMVARAVTLATAIRSVKQQ